MSHFSQLSPVGFLQTFVLELLQLTEEATDHQTDQIIERIAHTASDFFEAAYREQHLLDDRLEPDRYADLIVGLKNQIGGQFSLESVSSMSVHVLSRCCPFGEGVKHSPELCRMTSSVFGGIAARNYGYAKVELRERIALGDSQCSILVHLDPEDARRHTGIEYSQEKIVGQRGAVPPIQSRIDEKLHALWCQNRSGTQKSKDPGRPILVAQSAAMQSVLNAIEKVAPTPATVLIEGETGVGKELAARAIHAMSDRANQPFIAVNCGAIPEGLVESVLFGHEKGAFTGAAESHRGYFERANGGTLFLDEVDALTPAVQVRLLRTLQEGEFERVGAQRSLSVDVRIVAATNFGLARAVEQGSFRRDLFYRLNVVTLFIPRLADRREDIPHLVDHILKRLARRYGKTVDGLSETLMQKVVDHDWPGNVRELENMLERAVLFAKAPKLEELEFTKSAFTNARNESSIGGCKEMMEQAERHYLEKALIRHHGDVGEMAMEMKITRRAVYLKLKKFCIEPRDYRK